MLSSGTTLGQYEILELLGSGGIGEVYRARERSLQRLVAIKILSDAYSSNPEVLSRFDKEARLASSLNHPNIVTVHAVGWDHGIPYIAMELVDGVTLDEVIRRGPLPVRTVLDIATPIAGGLAKAHDAGVVHRDLKPLNVMVTRENLVKILDFGLGKIAAPPSLDAHASTRPMMTETRPGIILGTAGFMSPEQVRGANVDFRSDQFSFGSVLYEMATGKMPFVRETSVQTLAAIIEDEPPSIDAINSELPRPFLDVVRRCMAKNPDDRYSSTQELAQELRSIRDRVSAETHFLKALPKP